MTAPDRTSYPTHDDPGLQPERTVLSWTRTTVALSLVSAVLLRWAWVYGPWVFLLVLILIGLSGGIYLTQGVRYRRGVEGLVGEAVPPKAGAVVTLTGALLLLGAASIGLVLAAAG